MAKRLSQYFGIKAAELKAYGVLNAYIGLDNKLFIDPKLLEPPSVPEFKNARAEIKKYFAKVIVLVSKSKRHGDIAWTTAEKLLTVHEQSGVALGYAGPNEVGRASGPAMARQLVSRLKEIIDLGITDPEILELMGLFQEGFGSDFLSDMALAILQEPFLAYTQRVSIALNLSGNQSFSISGNLWSLPVRPNGKYLLFVPSKMLSKLPVALDRAEITEVSQFNQDVRAVWESLLWRANKENRRVTKEEIRDMLFEAPQNVRDLLEVYKSAAACGYDFEADPDGLFSWEFAGRRWADANPINIAIKQPTTVTDILQVLSAIVKQFKKNIEENKLYEVLYRDGGSGRARDEVFAQRLFYAVADSYCAASNVDLNREPNAGNGPVDFKLSAGYETRVLVEVKKSNNQKLLHGYETQLRAYEKSEATERSLYLIMRIAESQTLIKQVLALRDHELKLGKVVPEVVVIDARRKSSASKRRRRAAEST